MNRQAARNTDVQYSLEEIDGRIMPVIDTKNDTRKFDAAETYLKTLVDTQNPFATILSDAQPYISVRIYRVSTEARKIQKV